jgi:hypothetical protein
VGITEGWLLLLTEIGVNPESMDTFTWGRGGRERAAQLVIPCCLFFSEMFRLPDCYFFFLRLSLRPASPTRPLPSRSSVPGSGTDLGTASIDTASI